MEKNIIFVNNFVTKCLIGVYPKEKKKKQLIKISVKLKIRRKEVTDKLSSTLCYQKVLNILKNIDKYGHVNLVETLASKLATDFKKIKNVTKIIIKINKCEISQKGTDIGFILKRNLNNDKCL